MHDLCAFATEFVSMCVCAGILYGEACDGDNASRELPHIVDVDRAEQVRQMEQRRCSGRHKTRFTFALCRLKVRILATDDSAGMTGKHVCAESDSASTLCVSRVERAWLLLGLDVVAETKGSSMGCCGCHALFGSVSTSQSTRA